MENLIKIKWVSGSMPVVLRRRNDARLYLTKRELVDLRREIDEFIEFYKEDFLEENIDKEDNECDPDWGVIYDKKSV